MLIDDRIDQLFQGIRATVEAGEPKATQDGQICGSPDHDAINKEIAISRTHLAAVRKLRAGDLAGCIRALDGPACSDTDAIGLRILGYATLSVGNVDAAVGFFRRAVKADPFQLDCWAMLGGIHHRRGESQQAIEVYERAIVVLDGAPECAIALADLYVQQTQLPSAIRVLEYACRFDRGDEVLNLRLAELFLTRAARVKAVKRGRSPLKWIQNAADCFCRASRRNPTEKAFLGLGRCQLRLRNYRQAADAFRRVLDLNPESTEALTELGSTYLEDGRVSDATLLFRRVLALTPDHPIANFRYSKAKRFADNPASQTYLQNLTGAIDRQANDLSAANATSKLLFARGKVLDDISRHDEAWQCYDRANSIKKRIAENVNPRDQTRNRLVRDSIQFFTADQIGRTRISSPDDITPLFIVGMPRSGTTLTEQILSSHSKVAGAGELSLIAGIGNNLSREAKAAGERQNVRTVSGQELAYPQCMRGVPESVLVRLTNQYLDVLRRHRSADNRESIVTDKMPTNFLYLGLIATLMPGATIIHCRRNPLDVIASSFSQNLGLPFCNLDAIVDYYANYRSLMNHWSNVLDIKIYDVRYESMVSNPESQIRGLLDHCKLSWEPQCLDFQNNERSVRTPSKWQVRQPMYQTSVNRWKRFSRYLEPIESRLCALGFGDEIYSGAQSGVEFAQT